MCEWALANTLKLISSWIIYSHVDPLEETRRFNRKITAQTINAYKLFNYIRFWERGLWDFVCICTIPYLGMVDSLEFFAHSGHCMWHHHSMASDYCNFVFVFGQLVIVPDIDIPSIGSMSSNHHSLKRERERNEKISINLIIINIS